MTVRKMLYKPAQDFERSRNKVVSKLLREKFSVEEKEITVHILQLGKWFK